MNGLVRLTPRLVQSVVLGVTLIVSLGAIADRIGSDRVSSHVLVAAGLLLVLPSACSAALYTRRLFPARTLIVGTGALARKLVEEMSRRASTDRIWSSESRTMSPVRSIRRSAT